MIEEGDYVLIYNEGRNRYWLVQVKRGEKFVTELGKINLDELINKDYGETIETSKGIELKILRPVSKDYIFSFKRPTQIIYPKDLGYIIHMLGIKHNSRFLEIGTGSGALTTAVAWILSKEGEIVSYEKRSDFHKVASENIGKISPECRVKLINEEFPPTDFNYNNYFDAAFIDVDNPVDILSRVREALKPSGRVGILLPTYNQVDKLVEPFKKNFIHIETIEISKRELRFKKGRIRPEFRMIGFTAILTFGIKK